MATEERDHTDDWIVSPDRRPPSAFELQRRIDVAIGIARAAEEAAIEIGQASLEAAEQARRAAVHAERSAEASLAASNAVHAERSGETSLDTSQAGRAKRSAEAGFAVSRTVRTAEASSPRARGRSASPAGDDHVGPRPDGPPVAAPHEPAGHQAIPGSELPVAWSPVSEPRATKPPSTPMRRAAATAPAAPVTEGFPPLPPPNGSEPKLASGRPARPTTQPDPFDERMIAFRERAERVMVRLRRLEAASPVS